MAGDDDDFSGFFAYDDDPTDFDPFDPFDPDPGNGGTGITQTITLVNQARVTPGPAPISLGGSSPIGGAEWVNYSSWNGVRGAYNSNIDEQYTSGIDNLFSGMNILNQLEYLYDIGIGLQDYVVFENSNYEPEPLTDATPHSLASFLDDSIGGGGISSLGTAGYGDSQGSGRRATLDPSTLGTDNFGSTINWTVFDIEDMGPDETAETLIIGGEVDPDATNLTNLTPLELNPYSVGPHAMSEFYGKVPYDPEALFGAGGNDGSVDFTEGFISDRRLKYDIKLIGKSISGVNIYNFKYKNKKHGVGIYQGVMAQEVPYASKKVGKYYRVDYSKIDVKFKKIKG